MQQIPLELQDKIVLITGSTGGLGKEVTKAFLAAGARVIIAYRDQAKLERFLSALTEFEDRLTSIKTDVTEEKSVQELVRKTLEKYGRIDGLANLVGGFSGGETIAETEEKTWDFMMNLNLKSVFLSCKAVLPAMIEQKRGKIVNIASKAALKGKAKTGAYTVSKAGVITLTETIADEVKNYNINVNAILPSIIATEANIKRAPEADHSQWVKPEEIAQVALFLTSERAKGINGAAIPVYGKLL